MKWQIVIANFDDKCVYNKTFVCSRADAVIAAEREYEPGNMDKLIVIPADEDAVAFETPVPGCKLWVVTVNYVDRVHNFQGALVSAVSEERAKDLIRENCGAKLEGYTDSGRGIVCSVKHVGEPEIKREEVLVRWY